MLFIMSNRNSPTNRNSKYDPVFATILVCSMLGIFYCFFGNVYFSPTKPLYYHHDIIAEEFVKSQLELINVHNKYEVENGFVSKSKKHLYNGSLSINNFSSHVMTNWYNLNNKIKEDYITNCFGKHMSWLCSSQSPDDAFACGYLLHHQHSGLLRTIHGYPSIKEYDSLILSPKFTQVAYPREDPIVEVVKYWKNNNENKIIIRVNVFLPNGDKISLKDDRIKLYKLGWFNNNCDFMISSDLSLELNYDSSSGNYHLGRRVCTFGIGWNWENPIVNSPNVSYWLTRHPYHQSELRLKQRHDIDLPQTWF